MCRPIPRLFHYSLLKVTKTKELPLRRFSRHCRPIGTRGRWYSCEIGKSSPATINCKTSCSSDSHILVPLFQHCPHPVWQPSLAPSKLGKEINDCTRINGSKKVMHDDDNFAERCFGKESFSPTLRGKRFKKKFAMPKKVITIFAR